MHYFERSHIFCYNDGLIKFIYFVDEFQQGCHIFLRNWRERYKKGGRKFWMSSLYLMMKMKNVLLLDNEDVKCIASSMNDILFAAYLLSFSSIVLFQIFYSCITIDTYWLKIYDYSFSDRFQCDNNHLFSNTVIINNCFFYFWFLRILFHSYIDVCPINLFNLFLPGYTFGHTFGHTFTFKVINQ